MKIIFFLLVSVLMAGCTNQNYRINDDYSRELRSVTVYDDPNILKTLKNYKVLGNIAGSSCQSTFQDKPVTIPDARKELIQRASYSTGNAVIITKCEIMSSASNCYRLSVCEGLLLSVESKQQTLEPTT